MTCTTRGINHYRSTPTQLLESLYGDEKMILLCFTTDGLPIYSSITGDLDKYDRISFKGQYIFYIWTLIDDA